MAGKNYYEILGVQRNATEDQIKKAFRELAKKYHPDRNKGNKESERRFKEISEAYNVLIDKQKRTQYDQFGEARDRGFTGQEFWENIRRQQGARRGRTAQPPPPFGGGEEGFEWNEAEGLGDIFSQFFRRESPYGARQWRRGPARGEDVEAALEVPFDLAVNGGKMTIAVPGVFTCETCRGTGAEPGSSSQQCPVCRGAGSVQESQGGFAFTRPCPRCFGRGQIITTPCHTCNGSGQVQTTRRFTVTIPKGVSDGQKIRLAGQGQPGSEGGPPGDLLVEVRVLEHAQFTRKGNDVYSEVTVNIVQATLGARVTVPTVHGEASVRIPPGTQPDAKLRLKGRGIEAADGSKGDHYAVIRVAIPRGLTERQAALLRQFAESAGLETG